MTKLKCSVTNCSYNKERLCCLNSIKVDGTTAEVSDGTACASFRDRMSDSVTNSCGCKEEPKNSLSIECVAEKCVYNDSCRCTASAIDVEGSQATTCRDTKCATFKMS